MSIRSFARTAAVGVALFVSAASLARAPMPAFRGRVLRVADGDTLYVRAPGGRSVHVRLSAVDAPERGQPFANQSRQSLAALTSGIEVELVPRDIDGYGRVVGRLIAGGKDLGLEQIRRGMAWHYLHYAWQQDPRERTAYAAAERAARLSRAGLWGERAPVPPWEWRHGR